MKVFVHEMNLMKNQIIEKFQKFWNFKGKGCKEKNSFFNHLTTKKMFNRFKMSSLRCRSHVQEIILPKNMFGYPLKFILAIFGDFYIFSYKPKYSCTIMYECEKSPPPHQLF
jgi:hypothetical protein